MGDEVLTVQIVVNGGDKASQTVNNMSKSTTGLSSAFTKLIPGAGKATGELENMGGMLTKLAPSLGISAEAAAGMSSSLVAMAGPIAIIIAAVGVATIAFTGLYKAISFALAEAENAEKQQAQLGAVIKSTGGVAGVSADMINSLAVELSALSGVEDELIISSSNLLLTFTSIGKDIFPQAQRAALDISQAFGMDLAGASVMLGKALQDPATGMSALKRVGVSFSEEMVKAAQSMVEHGQIARAQALILGEVSKQVAGSAAAMGSTVTGEGNKIANLLKNIGEGFGVAFLPLKGDMLVIVRTLLTEISHSLQPALALLRQEVRHFQTVMRDPEMKRDVQELIQGLSALFGEVALMAVKELSGGVRGFLQEWRRSGPEIMDFIKGMINDLVLLAKTINRVMDALGRLGIMSSDARSRGVSLPGYANGVTNAPGGWAMVGERGPELVQLPRGSNVYPSGTAPSGGGGFKNFGPTTIYVNNDTTMANLLQQWEAAATATA